MDSAALDHRQLARIVASLRIVIGLLLLVVPDRLGRAWLGQSGAEPGATPLLRAIGGRDVVLGTAVLAAQRSGKPATAEVLAGAFCDGVDALGLAAAFGHLDRKARWRALAASAGATALGLAVARGLARER